MIKYRIGSTFQANVGYAVSANQVAEAADRTNATLKRLPAPLYRSLDYKTTNAIIGSVFCDALSSQTEGIVNPIEKGHPDIIPPAGANATEEQLRNYPQGLEIKCTVGNIEQGANLRAGEERVSRITAITWQAHHREVKELMGLVWDFVQSEDTFLFPGITAICYANDLVQEDWGTISGTPGRNTKVTGMRTSGKQKMGFGWVLLMDDPRFLTTYTRVLGISLPG